MKIVKNSIYADIKSILEKARSNAVRAVNFSMVLAYWHVGKRIVEEEQQGNKRAVYGESIIEELASKLTADFGKGFNATNLKYFRQFFLVFSEYSIGHTVSDQFKDKAVKIKSHAASDESSKNIRVSISSFLRPELSWTHYRHLLRVESNDARKYYI